MDLKWLNDLVALSETGGFAKAARRRRVTQPAFSKRIRALEDWVGVKLVSRDAHPVRLTEAGERFLIAARQITEAVLAAKSEAQAADGQKPDLVVFTAATTLSQRFFPKWITRMKARCPDLRARMQHYGHFNAHFEALANREVDFLIGYHDGSAGPRIDRSGLIWKQIGRSSLLPVSKSLKNGAPAFPIAETEEGLIPHLARTEGSYLGLVLESHLREWDLKLDNLFELTSTVAIKNMVLEGHGLAWLSSESIEAELRTGSLVQAHPDRWRIPLEIRLYRLDRRIGPQAEALWDQVRAV